jgi:hypothetical protein
MRRIAESSFQSLSSQFGSISGCRSKVFLSPAYGGVESSAEPIMENHPLKRVITEIKKIGFTLTSFATVI